MLREIRSVRQNKHEAHKRWFNSSNMDLFIWCNDDNHIIKYQLTYTLLHQKKALIWQTKEGFTYARVDDETRSGNHPTSPILITDNPCDTNILLTLFIEKSGNVENEVKTFIISSIKHLTS
jgi:hypothetical protein